MFVVAGCLGCCCFLYSKMSALAGMKALKVVWFEILFIYIFRRVVCIHRLDSFFCPCYHRTHATDSPPTRCNVAVDECYVSLVVQFLTNTLLRSGLILSILQKPLLQPPYFLVPEFPPSPTVPVSLPPLHPLSKSKIWSLFDSSELKEGKQVSSTHVGQKV